ncbi:hypothetical protein M011DRAFT_465391 [Sporormia fimetaria CBS 119925]|uniref:Uncharacterized protein n=1 Tax=Sporormia fimetaria CBS 119925 TaxID=1340428 RepID=A0A6A6VGH8_9PLEO|nr:hypothetical protein M011DRAFT_465391 [Sporormia fimetaria CBS 119925]
MASYFDVQPPSKATAEVLKPSYDGINDARRDGLLTPQVTRILDELDENHSDSGDSDSDSESEVGQDLDRGCADKRETSKGKEAETSMSQRKDSGVQESLQKTSSSSGSSDKSHKGSPHSASRLRHPRLDRFVSLRSTLFSAHVADKLEAERESKDTEHPPKKTSPDRGMNTDATHEPETNKRQGLARRMTDKLRKVTSKEVPTMAKIHEGAALSKQSSNAEDASGERHHKKRDSGHIESDDNDNDCLRQSEIEDLVRWVSQRNKVGEGELPTTSVVSDGEKRGSLKPEDVDELVSFIAQRRKGAADSNKADTATKAKPESSQHDDNLSDPSTESDLEDDDDSRDLDEDDVNDLVKWVSRSKDPTGGNGGPVKSSRIESSKQPSSKKSSSNSSRSHTGNNTPKAMPNAAKQSSPLARVSETQASPLRSSKVPDYPESVATEEDLEANLDNEDIKLLRTVTRDDSSKEQELMREAAILKWRLERDEQRKLGRVDSRHRNSLTEEDVDELVKEVNEKLKMRESRA